MLGREALFIGSSWAGRSDIAPPCSCGSFGECSRSESTDEAGEKLRAFDQCIHFDEFVCGVCLVDGAWPDADARDAASREMRGVGEPGRACGSRSIL